LQWGRQGNFVRGIPEMHVKDVQMSNVFIQAEEGIDIQEATGIHLNTITVHAKSKNSLIYALNSSDIKIKGFDFPTNQICFYKHMVQEQRILAFS